MRNTDEFPITADEVIDGLKALDASFARYESIPDMRRVYLGKVLDFIARDAAAEFHTWMASNGR